jgi:acetylornithine deacetylase
MNDPIELLARLVAIDSVNPDLVPGARGEAEIAGFVAGWLRDRGLEVHVEETSRPGRPNVVAVARGSGAGSGEARPAERGGQARAPLGRSLMLNAHLDTVGVAGMRDPFTPAVSAGRMRGRGAMDTKGALAAFMCAAADARELRLRGDVILTAVSDEEFASAGTEAVARGWRAEAAIVGEPTGLDVVIAHKGFVWLQVETRGVAAHGSLPGVGVDAIAKMGGVLRALDDLADRLAAGRAHPILGPGSVHASLVTGGQELSSYPGSCTLGIERRTIPGETPDDAERELRDILGRLEAGDPSFKATLRRLFSREPMEADRDSAVAAAVARQVRAVMGREPAFTGMAGWLDSALLSAAGIPTVVLGPKGEGLHGVEEWVDLASVEACRRITVGAIGELCG